MMAAVHLADAPAKNVCSGVIIFSPSTFSIPISIIIGQLFPTNQ
jgi:hypothetical protein